MEVDLHVSDSLYWGCYMRITSQPNVKDWYINHLLMKQWVREADGQETDWHDQTGEVQPLSFSDTLFLCPSPQLTLHLSSSSCSLPPDLWPLLHPEGRRRIPELQQRCGVIGGAAVGWAPLLSLCTIMSLSSLSGAPGPPAPGDKGSSCLEAFDGWFWAPRVGPAAGRWES